MCKNNKRFLQDSAPYIHITANDAILKELQGIDVKEDTYLAVLDGGKMKYNGGFFKEVYKAFHFPDYIIKDWTYFDEAMNELDWIHAKHFILEIRDADQLLSGFGMRSYRNQFWAIMSSVIMGWVNGRNYDDFPTPPTPFHMVLSVPHEKQEKFVMDLKKLIRLEINEI